jgi:hypothetical protein
VRCVKGSVAHANLEADGISTASLHSYRPRNQRLCALRDFKSGAMRVRVRIATDIAARGKISSIRLYGEVAKRLDCSLTNFVDRRNFHTF